MANDVLIEIGTEELPSGLVWPLVDAFGIHLKAALADAAIRHGTLRCFATPRRLAVLIKQVEEKQPPQVIERRGPAVAIATGADGQPLPALKGFVKSCGVAMEALSIKKTDKGEWWVYEETRAGRLTQDCLPQMVKEACAVLPISKPMRWGASEIEFVRPVHWVVCLWGDQVISAEILGVKVGRESRGHRFHHPGTVSISTPDAYEALLKQAFVIPDFQARRMEIVTQVHALASAKACQAVMPTTLLDEVTSIVEWPQVVLGNIDSSFLSLPSEVLIASMQAHQKCFALRNADDQLAPYFISVANIASKEPSVVQQGNEKVMHARLSDAAFFYQHDRKQALSAYRSATAKVLFQALLGNLEEKAIRMERLIALLAESLDLAPVEAIRAASLSKCDLMTGMVGEFPDLQGIMGYYYAKEDGEQERVAVALKEQYMPRFAADELPSSALGMALSLVDRLDTLVGLFAIGQKPTGVKDPFKLRRHALAVVRLLLNMPAFLPLSWLLQQTLEGYSERIQPVDGAMDELKAFILDRLHSYMLTKGIMGELVQAVRTRQDEWLFDLNKRLQSLVSFVSLPDATALAAASKRVKNVLQQAPSFISPTEMSVDPSLFNEPAEHQLFQRISAIEEGIEPYYKEGRYDLILHELAHLREPVDAFFDQVMVMVEEKAIKMNRLCLLAQLQRLLLGVADISFVQQGL